MPFGTLEREERTAKWDANDDLFFNEQLTLIEDELFEIVYAELKARSHFVVNFQGGPAIETIKYYVMDRYGAAAVGLGFPRVGVKRFPRFINIQSLTDSYGYNFQEIRAAQHEGMDLDNAEALAAHRKIAELEDKIAYLGDPESGLFGAFTHPNFPVMLGTIPLAEGTTATPPQIVSEVNRIINAPRRMTKGIERINTCLVPDHMLAYWETTPYGPEGNVTIMERIRRGHPNVEFDDCWWAAGGGPAGEDIIFPYNRDRRNMEFRVPSDFETFDPRPEAKQEYVIECHERCGGLQVRFAVGVVYLAAA
jgi:hypothetical protein